MMAKGYRDWSRDIRRDHHPMPCIEVLFGAFQVDSLTPTDEPFRAEPSRDQEGMVAGLRWSDVFRPLVGEFKVDSATARDLPTKVSIPQLEIIIIPSPSLLPLRWMRDPGPPH